MLTLKISSPYYFWRVKPTIFNITIIKSYTKDHRVLIHLNYIIISCMLGIILCRNQIPFTINCIIIFVNISNQQMISITPIYYLFH